MTILSPATIKQALLMAPKPVLIASPPLHPNSYEQEHVHAVYDTIASHFSSTRYKVCLHAIHLMPDTKLNQAMAYCSGFSALYSYGLGRT